MQIVIDIPEGNYKAICETKNVWEREPKQIIYLAIANGTQLPKGHGRLKDIDKIISDGRSKGFCEWYDEMKYADTIIEADVEESEG